MGGLTRPPALDRGIDVALRHDRWVVAGSVAAVIALAWIYLWHDAAMMAAMPAQMTASAAFGMTFTMWTVMMVGMMLPSATPALLLYGAMVRGHRERGSVLPATWTFAAGYLVVWTAFSAAASLLQLMLEQAKLLSPLLASASRPLDAAILIAAGIYQWTPLKRACLRQCRAPLQFFMTRWRAGSGGAFRMGT